MEGMCRVGHFISENIMDREAIFLSPRLYSTQHFPNEKKSLKHSKDLRNCPIVLYFDMGHFTHISFLLRDPVVVMPVQYTPMSLNDFIATYNVKKTPIRIHKTYCKVVHNFVYNMIYNIMKHQQEEEENVQAARKEEYMAIEAIKGTKRKLAEWRRLLAQEKMEKECHSRNVQIDVTENKMSKCLYKYLIKTR